MPHTHCPFCYQKLKKENIPPTQKLICNNYGHLFYLILNKEITFMKFSTNAKYSHFVELNYQTQTSQIVCPQNGTEWRLQLPTLLQPDFPSLTLLKEQINTYLLFA